MIEQKIHERIALPRNTVIYYVAGCWYTVRILSAVINFRNDFIFLYSFRWPELCAPRFGCDTERIWEHSTKHTEMTKHRKKQQNYFDEHRLGLGSEYNKTNIIASLQTFNKR